MKPDEQWHRGLRQRSGCPPASGRLVLVRWAMESDLVSGDEAPSLLDFVDADALEAEDGRAVSIIHRGENR